jgi:hypothetical protein
MQYEANALHFLQYAASLSSILTSLVASLAAVYVWYGRSVRRRKLEHYLADVMASAGETGERRRSILHLIAALGMNEDEILSASFSSDKIRRDLVANERTGRAEAIMLEYRAAGSPESNAR